MHVNLDGERSGLLVRGMMVGGLLVLPFWLALGAALLNL